MYMIFLKLLAFANESQACIQPLANVSVSSFEKRQNT